jgi:hypothetical protein
MTDVLEHPETTTSPPEAIGKVSIIISKGSLEGIYPRHLGGRFPGRLLARHR